MSGKHQYYDQKQPQARVTAVSSQEIIHHQGPLPPSDEFARYEEAVRGAGERILALAESEAAFRQKLDERTTDAAIKLGFRGQIFAAVLTLASLGVIFYGIHMAYPLAFIPGAIMGFSGLASIFMTGGRNR